MHITVNNEPPCKPPCKSEIKEKLKIEEDR